MMLSNWITLKRTLTLLVCSVTVTFCLAEETPESDAGFYMGVFGGIGSSSSTSLQQLGAVFLNPPSATPTLPVDAYGTTNNTRNIPVGGIQLGYEWDHWDLGSDWGLRPGVEIEGLYIGKHSPVGDMPVRPSFLGTQYVTIPMTTGVVLANAVFTIKTPYSDKIFPYFGGAFGLAVVSIDGSDSANPSEPGINHFNSNPDASDTALALQAKVGVKAEVYEHVFLFLEYRYLNIASTQYTFGSTDYPGLHLPTTIWSVNMGRQEYNLFIAGLQYKF